MSYTTLDNAQAALRVRLKLLEAYESALPGLRKSQAGDKSTPGTSQGQVRTRRRYDFCLSFAGEDWDFVDRFVAEMRRQAPTVKLFYDRERKAELLGTDLYEVLGDVYEHQARHCIMFVSGHYVRKRWTRHERQFITTRALEEADYLLPIRLDATRVPGISSGIGHLDAADHTVIRIPINPLSSATSGSWSRL